VDYKVLGAIKDKKGALDIVESLKNKWVKMDKQEQKMLDEVALRNAIIKFQRLNKKNAIPEVGIFWIDGSTGKMFAEGISLREASDYGECRIFEGSHHDLWDKAVKTNPKWRGLEYEDIARGRVVYRRDPKNPEFIVYMPKQLMKHKGKVISRFKLPQGHVRFDITDEHYRI
jgi:hypothetical protein